MKLNRLLAALFCAGALYGQTFIQMSDPQFGMYAKDADFVHETANFEFAVAAANRVKPAFVIVTGDLTNKSTDSAQVAEYKRISAKLDPSIKLYSVPGNHDVGNEPTAQSLATYRERYGADYYSFRSGGIYGIVLNSNLEKGAEKVPQEAAKMESWFRDELAKAKQSGAKSIIVFQHISFFLKDAKEADEYFNIPLAVRERYLNMMHDAGVKVAFCGHYHRNSLGRDGDLEMVTTGPVGMPLGGAKSGIRMVTVTDAGIKHEYRDFGDLP